MTAEDVARRLVADAVARDVAVGCAVRTGGAGGGPPRWRIETGGSTTVFFDLASLTKPMTAVAIARSGLDRRSPLDALLPEVCGTASASLPLELFLAHRAGLEAHRLLFSGGIGGPGHAVAALREAADARRADATGIPPEEGFTPVYSDLSYILAGEAFARAARARDAGDAIGRVLLEPLGVADRLGTRRELAARGVWGPYAPTESVAWRGGSLAGVVHDENAWGLTREGGSGHAGLFGTVDAVLAFALYVLDALDGLNRLDRLDSRDGFSVDAARGGAGGAPLDLTWLVRARPGGSLRAGFDGKSRSGSSAGDRFGPLSFGHLGFTGTSFWVDPEAKVAVVLLTNRVCPTRENVRIRAARPWAHGALFDRALALPLV